MKKQGVLLISEQVEASDQAIFLETKGSDRRESIKHNIILLNVIEFYLSEVILYLSGIRFYLSEILFRLSGIHLTKVEYIFRTIETSTTFAK